MRTLITVPIQVRDPHHVSLFLKRKSIGVDAFEIWIDQFPLSQLTSENINSQIMKWKKMTKKKLVIVCKDKIERGKFIGSAQQKIDLLLAAVQAGANYVDAGLHTTTSELKRLVEGKKKTKVILSFHDFEKTPSTKSLESQCNRMLEIGADVVKIATLCHSVSDTERLMELALRLKIQKTRHIVLGMGEKGVITRIFADRIGNELNFVSVDVKTAPGQICLDDFLKFKKTLN